MGDEFMIIQSGRRGRRRHSTDVKRLPSPLNDRDQFRRRITIAHPQRGEAIYF